MRTWKPWKHDNDSVHAKPMYQAQIEIDTLRDRNKQLLSIAGELALQLKIATDPYFSHEQPENTNGCPACDALARYSSFLDSLEHD